MASSEDARLTRISTIDVDNKKVNVSVRIGWDGIEFVGRLWFTEDGVPDSGVTDRGAIPGRTREEVLALAQGIYPHELTQRFRRAVSEKRRFHGLRRVTDEILAKIRYLNQLALSMRAGLLDADGAAAEIELTERQLHELIDRLRGQAGVENESGPR